MRRLRVAAVAATLVAGAVVTVVVGAAPAQAAPVICEKFGATSILNDQFIVMNNVWGADTAQCIDVNQSGGFTVTQAAHNKATNGAPAAYPAIYAGCHYAATPADCTTGSGLPMQANTAAFGNVRTSVSYTYPASGTWNAAYDIWFDPTPRMNGQNTGAEIMIWLNFQGSIQPVGSQVATVNLAGGTWQVWFGNVGWNVVTYRRTSATTSLNFAVNTFYNDAVSRGFAQSSWYMTSVQAGSEPWVGGAGMAVNSFTYTTTGGGDTTPPSVPQNLTASGTTASSTNLSWSASTDNVGVTGYTIFRRTGTSGTFAQVGTSTGTTFAATGLTASTQYQFNVVARDAAGNNSTASSNVTVTTGGGQGDTTPPSVPQNLTASGTTSSGTNLSWSASTDNVGVTGYTIFRRTGTSGTFTQVGTSTGTTFAATGLSANTTYQFNVTARDAAGNNSGASGNVTVTTTGGTTGGCSATVSVPNPWANGYVAYVRINNTGTSTINAWSVPFTMPAGHTFVSNWNATFSGSLPNITARNVGHNGTIAPGQFTEWGFQAARPNGNTALPTFGNCAVG